MAEHSIDRPIIFSGPMVRALLDGRKTMTRRLLRRAGHANGEAVTFNSPYRKLAPGDRLWVREAWSTTKPLDTKSPALIGELCLEAGYKTPWAPIRYLADGREINWPDGGEEGRRRASIHMPRWASRLTLDVAAVRVERLRDISEEDAINEGLLRQEGCGGKPGPSSGYNWKGIGYHGAGFDRFGGATFHTPDGEGRCSCNVSGPSPAQCAFRELWDSLHGTGAWEANPEIVALELHCKSQKYR